MLGGGDVMDGAVADAVLEGIGVEAAEDAAGVDLGAAPLTICSVFPKKADKVRCECPSVTCDRRSSLAYQGNESTGSVGIPSCIL